MSEETWRSVWASIKRAMLKDAEPFFDDVAMHCIKPHITALEFRAEAAEAKVAKLLDALREIDDMCPATCDMTVAHGMADIARAAIEETSRG